MTRFNKYDLIMIDTCSFLDDGFVAFFNDFYQDIQTTKLVIPSCVYNEIEKKALSDSLQSNAFTALHIIRNLVKTGKAFIVGNKSDSFADSVILSNITALRLIKNILLITQDRGLTKDVLDLNNLVSQKSNKIVECKFINKNGGLEMYSSEMKKTNFNNQSIKRVQKPLFNYCGGKTMINDGKLIQTSIPGLGESVVVNGKQVVLKKRLASGGEGTVYETSLGSDVLVKIYKDTKLNTNRKAKVSLMISKKLEDDCICWPLAIVKNSHNEFVGYVMKKAKGVVLDELGKPKYVVESNYPHLNRTDLSKILLNLLIKIQKLHKNGIIIGDINPNNFLFDINSKKVYLIDTDSYQIEKFPCEVGTIYFRDPALSSSNVNTLLTYQNEAYGIAVLVFKTLMMGKSVYSSQGDGSTIQDQMKKMNFPYHINDNITSSDAAKGVWPFIWSHFTRKLKEHFINSFQYDMPNSKYGSRYDINEWVNVVNEYNYLLESGKLASQDSESIKLYPTRCKKIGQSSYANKKYSLSTNQLNNMNNRVKQNNRQSVNPPQKKVTQASNKINKVTPKKKPGLLKKIIQWAF